MFDGNLLPGFGQVVQFESTLFLAFQTLLLVNVMPPLSGRWFEESVWQCKLAINMMSGAHRAARTPFCPALRCRSCSNIFRQTYFVNWSLWCLHINHWFVMDTWSTGWGCGMICICNPCALCSFNIKTIWRYLSHWPPPFFVRVSLNWIWHISCGSHRGRDALGRMEF